MTKLIDRLLGSIQCWNYELTEDALVQYELDDWGIQASSEAEMITVLQETMEKEEPIIVTLWKPHWAFGVMDLKVLEDPQGIYGGDGGHISIVANNEMEQYTPAAYQFINQYTETYDMIEEIMPKVYAEDRDPLDVAREFIEENPDLIDKWTEGLPSK